MNAKVLNSLMSLTPVAWKTIRSTIQNLLLENSELDRNAALKEKYAFIFFFNKITKKNPLKKSLILTILK